jgi:ferric-dicitrate binding protein FerR (iron transport regulator)
MITANGRQYHLELSDGTKVWMNAGSSIRFPSTFQKENREVEVTGELYFEVAHDPKRPFKVHVSSTPGEGIVLGMDKGVVEVFGTSFNINAYNDEELVKTTLVEGSVKYFKGNDLQLLKPRQQAQLNRLGAVTLVQNPDVESTIAWKNGNFRFENADIYSIGRQMARWYDVEVEFEDKIEYTFVGEISRDVPVSKFLKLLELTGVVHFRIEGKKIVVTK